MELFKRYYVDSNTKMFYTWLDGSYLDYWNIKTNIPVGRRWRYRIRCYPLKGRSYTESVGDLLHFRKYGNPFMIGL